MSIADAVLSNPLAQSQKYLLITGQVLDHGILTVNNVTFSGFFAVSIQHMTNIRLTNCNFYGVIGDPTSGSRGQTVLIYNSQEVYFINCEFRDNVGTPVVAIDSDFILSGTNSFSNNTAYLGGALALYGYSHVLLANGSQTTFSDNSAETVGGVIFVDYMALEPCFFQLEGDYVCSTSFAPNFSLTFGNNRAEIGGTKVYGAGFDYCNVSSNNHFDNCEGWNFVSSVFDVDLRDNPDLSAIASAPRRACLCENGRPSCTTVFSNRTLFPGDTLEIPVVVVGDRFGTVDGSVYAHLLPWPPSSSGRMAYMEPLQSSQRVEDQNCTNLSYTILCNSSTVTLVLTAMSTLLPQYQYPSATLYNTIYKEISKFEETGRIGVNLRSIPVYVNITLLPCPMGFELSGKKPQCICDPQLTKNSMSCNLATQTVKRSGSQWVNAFMKNSEYSGVIVSKYCPNNYCKEDVVNVNLKYPDSQCDFKHSGILCGGCQAGLSLTLGSAQCLSCPNDYLALLIPFSLAGFALVFFIKVLNLTVEKGTLNGLIFYANIVRANQFVWIPVEKTTPLTVFIAWLNLDLGIETCFFDGLNAYWKMWLQFIFPLYIWAIATAIVVISHHSSTVAKFFGGNSVQVLATLLFLSYSKLLHTIIVILQPSRVVYPDKETFVWSYDGNILYLCSKHVPLFLVALAVIMFLWLPYTGILTSAQFLQRVPSYRITKMLVKVKPVLDAYYGPFKDNHRYWVGLLLLVRGLLFIAFAATPTSHSDIGLLFTFTAVLALLMYLAYIGPVYKKNYLSLLENSYIVNLGVLAGGTLYVSTSSGSQATLAYISVGVAFVQFVVVLAIHATASLKVLLMRCHRPTVQGPDRAEYEGLADSPVENAQAFQELVISYDDFREPILKYSDSET